MARQDEDGMLFKNSSVDPSEPKRPATRFRFWVIVISLILAGAFLAVVVAIGIQHHNDRLLSARLIQSEVELQTTGATIADIKDHKFKTMAEYVSAYVQIEPLLSDYDHKLQAYADLCNRAQRRDERRTLINILRREEPYSPEIWRDASEIIQLVRQISSVMKKEASVIRDMSSFPEDEQVQFWHEEFVPLLAQEHALRERLALAGQRMSSEPTSQ
jgi:hypothetical protein